MVGDLLCEEFCAFDAGGVVVGYDGDAGGANAADQGGEVLGSCLARRASDGQIGDWWLVIGGWCGEI